MVKDGGAGRYSVTGLLVNMVLVSGMPETAAAVTAPTFLSRCKIRSTDPRPIFGSGPVAQNFPPFYRVRKSPPRTAACPPRRCFLAVNKGWSFYGIPNFHGYFIYHAVVSVRCLEKAAYSIKWLLFRRCLNLNESILESARH